MIVKGYRYGEPDIGDIVVALKSVNELKTFLRSNGLVPNDEDDLWIVYGKLVEHTDYEDDFLIEIETYEHLNI